MDTDIVLACADKYNKKYYFNQEYSVFPKEIKDRIKYILISFVERAGGTLSLEMDNNELVFKTNILDSDIYYDEIESGLLINKIRNENRELLEKIYTYLIYKDKIKERD